VKNPLYLAAKAAYRLCFYSPHWHIGWRFVGDGDGVWERHDLGGVRWQTLPNPRFRFFADPFPISRDRTMHVFFEDFDHRRGKGAISAIAFGPAGPVGAAFTVLEEPWHLSYPFLIEDEGEVWMVPESSASGAVSIYRADPFPHRWRRETDLLRGIEASDATIVFYDGRFWMFATVGDGAVSAALHVFLAPRLLGPWRAHPKNPVLLDRSCARPAGRMIVRNGRLWRPVQDCRRAYGAALGLAEVTRLDCKGYDQAVRKVLRPGSDWPGRRLHTLNQARGFEFIDGSAMRLRLSDMRPRNEMPG